MDRDAKTCFHDIEFWGKQKLYHWAIFCVCKFTRRQRKESKRPLSVGKAKVVRSYLHFCMLSFKQSKHVTRLMCILLPGTYTPRLSVLPCQVQFSYNISSRKYFGACLKAIEGFDINSPQGSKLQSRSSYDSKPRYMTSGNRPCISTLRCNWLSWAKRVCSSYISSVQWIREMQLTDNSVPHKAET